MTTFEPSQPTLFDAMELPLMSSAAAFHAKTSAMQGLAQVSTASAAAYGANMHGSFAKFDHASYSWKTSQLSLDGGLAEFSGTWPQAGMMRNGNASELMQLALRKRGSASGYWQTPTTRDGKGQSGLGNRIKRGRNGRLHVANLCDQIVDTGRRDLVRSPTFREWLMGLPIGWTDVRQSATPSSRKSRKSSDGQS